MINHRVHRVFHRGHKRNGVGKTLRTLWFFTLCTLWLNFSVLPLKAIPPKDTTKQQFDLNDPRNPHCPCHKYQKQAEEEYQKLMKLKSDGNTTIYKSVIPHRKISFIKLFFNQKKGVARNYSKRKNRKKRNNLCYQF